MSTEPSILLINPPIYDFAAFDFWLRPLGLLTVAGKIAKSADFWLFDFLDRNHKFYSAREEFKSDEWGKGPFFSEIIPKPEPLKKIPRYYRRFGLPQELFIEFLKTNKPCDFVLVQTVMTYWYQGYQEIIKTVKTYWPGTKIVLGGPYSLICPQHAQTLGADFVLTEKRLDKLWDYLSIRPDGSFVPVWGLCNGQKTAAIKLTNGCPFKCTYCTVPLFSGGFTAKPVEQTIEELKYLVSLGIKNIAFYDDALLYNSEEVLKPFLKYVIKNKINVNFHNPNALNARFIDTEIAILLVKAGCKSFYLGFESSVDGFHKQTGSKVFDRELSRAVEILTAAGAEISSITAYLMLGHPRYEIQDLTESMKFVNSLGVRIMLADFSPIPGTPDGKLCRQYVDMDEPLMHSKTVFPIILFGNDRTNRIKDMCRELNDNLQRS